MCHGLWHVNVSRSELEVWLLANRTGPSNREVGERTKAASAGGGSLQIGPTFHLLPFCKVGCAAKVACKGKSTSPDPLCPAMPPAGTVAHYYTVFLLIILSIGFASVPVRSAAAPGSVEVSVAFTPPLRSISSAILDVKLQPTFLSGQLLTSPASIRIQLSGTGISCAANATVVFILPFSGLAADANIDATAPSLPILTIRLSHIRQRYLRLPHLVSNQGSVHTNARAVTRQLDNIVRHG